MVANAHRGPFAESSRIPLDPTHPILRRGIGCK